MNLYNIGYIAGFHGIKGELKVKVVTDFKEDRFYEGNEVLLVSPSGEFKSVEIERVRSHKDFELVTLKGYYNINQVEGYKGWTFKVKEEDLFELEEDEYYDFELIGLEVRLNNERVGEVVDILKTNANDILVTRLNNKKEVLIPLIKDFILDINIEEEYLVIDEVEGLLE